MGEAKRKKQLGIYFKPQEGAYTNAHHLIEEKVVPDAVVRLRNLLQRPENADISKAALKGQAGPECLGIIAACVGVALDGDYNLIDLCDMLSDVISAANGANINPSLLHPKLVDAELTETAGELILQESFQSYMEAKSVDKLRVYGNNVFMAEQKCKVCNHIVMCRDVGKCLGNAPETMEAAIDHAKRKTLH